MSGPSIYISIDKRFQPLVDAAWLEGVVKHVLASEQVSDTAEVSLLVTGQARVRRLNRDYRDMDENTDVLSFALTEVPDRRTKFLLPPDGVLRLGEVIISYPQATIQAARRGESVQREVAALAVHGVLHLLGYDHEKKADAPRMQAREISIFASLPRCGG